MSNNYTPEAVQCLTQLGFPDLQLRIGASNVQHPIHRQLIVSPARHADEFRLYYAGPRLDGIKIPTRLVNTSRPRWKQTIARWYQHAVFTLAEIQRAREAAESKIKEERERLLTRITDLIPAGVNTTAEEVHALIPLALDGDGQLNTAQYYCSVNLNLNGVVEGELVSIVARLKAFLKKENIPHR